jgi:cell division ATPase FtsA
VFAALAVELHDAPGVEETVEAVVEFALQAEGCAYAGVALAVRGGRAQIAAVTDPVIEALYQLPWCPR